MPLWTCGQLGDYSLTDGSDSLPLRVQLPQHPSVFVVHNVPTCLIDARALRCTCARTQPLTTPLLAIVGSLPNAAVPHKWITMVALMEMDDTTAVLLHTVLNHFFPLIDNQRAGGTSRPVGAERPRSQNIHRGVKRDRICPNDFSHLSQTTLLVMAQTLYTMD